MESGISDMLSPDALPRLHSIVPAREEDESHPEGVLSTVDIAALNDGGIDHGFHMGNAWRSTATPRRREKPVETLKNDKQSHNGLHKTPCISEESQESTGSSDSDSDSDCDKCSSSSSSCDSSCSSSSSDSSDSSSDEESTASSLSSSHKSRKPSSSTEPPAVNGGSSSSTKKLLDRVKKSEGYASSSDSRSSRERKSKRDKHKKLSVDKQPSSGSLKLRIAALKPPSRSNGENYFSASSPWLVASSNDTPSKDGLSIIDHRQKSLSKSPSKGAVSASPVPDQSQKKSPQITTSSPDKKHSTKNSTSWYKSTSKKDTSPPVSPEEPKRKSKLSCLIASMSPKSRHKHQNGTSSPSQLLSNGDSKDRKSISPQKAAPLQPQTSPQDYYHSNRKPGQVTMKTCSTSNLPHLSHEGNCTNNYNTNSLGGGTGSTPITTPIRTKAAKKYIPEDHLVIPQVVVTPPTPQVTSPPKKTSKRDEAPADKQLNSGANKKKSKKSKGKRDEKKLSEKKKKGKTRKPEPPGFQEVCRDLFGMALGSGSPPGDKKSINQRVQEPFIFSQRKYTKIDQVMSKFTHPRNSFPKSPVASTSHTSSSGRKRKLNIVNDKMKETASSQIQRLPLKKRHHHTSSVEKSTGSTGMEVGTVHKFGVNTKPGFVRQVFQTISGGGGGRWKVEGSADFGELKKRQSESSTNSSTKENEVSPVKVGGAKKGRPKGKGKMGRQSEPAKKLVLSPDIVDAPEASRRSSRPRQTRKLQLDNAQEEKTEKAEEKVQKRGMRKEMKKIKTGTDESLTTALASSENEEAPPVLVKCDSPPKRKPGRKRNISTGGDAESGPLKKIKLSNGGTVGGLEIESLNESEISTEVETDVELAMMSPPSSVTTTPLTSPPQQQSVKKRRKVNRTGFPNVKKKRKSTTGGQTAAAKTVKVTRTISEDGAIVKMQEHQLPPVSPAGEVTIQKNENHVIIIKRETPVEIVRESIPSSEKATGKVSSSSSPAPDNGEGKLVPKFTPMLATSSFVDSSEESSSTDMKVASIPEVILELVQISNPPVVVPPKNNYVECGLLSNYFKHKEAEGKERTRSAIESENPLLPLPPDPESSEFTTTIPRDFVLPYDAFCLGVLRAKGLFEAYENVRKEELASQKAQFEALKREEIAAARLAARRKSEVDTSSIASSSGSGSSKPKKAKMPENQPSSWSFRRLKSNTYYGMSKPPTSTEFETNCSCEEGPLKCSTDDCLNRVVYTECPTTCGFNCKNQRIQKHDWAPGIKRQLTNEKGYGVFAMEEIKKGDFILEYVGEVVTDAVFKERMNTIYVNDTHHYCLQLDGGMVIDGHRSGGEGRFVNHSCEPNCEMQKWSVSGLSRMALFALRDIKPNEELSYDYNFSLFNPSEGQSCFCGSEKCRGIIGVRAKNGKNGDNSANGRKNRGIGMGMTLNGIPGGIQDLLNPEKMKHLTKKDRSFVQRHNCFLIRNYEKIRKMRHEVEDKVNLSERLEKIMLSWTTRYKAGSTKNKPPQVPDDDPKLSRLAKISQIFYELFVKLTTAKDESGALLCQTFMAAPSKRKCPLLYTSTEEPLDLNQLCRKILRGEYRSLTAFESDLGLTLSNFEQALSKEKPEISETIQLIKQFYKGLKVKAVDELEPFIVHKTNKGSTVPNELPEFRSIPVNPKVDDVIRCICERFTDDGMMIQCDKCFAWQHGDCMRVFNSQTEAGNKKRRNNKKNQRRSKFFSPVENSTATSGEDSCQGTPVKEGIVQIPLVSPALSSPRNNKPLAIREEVVCLDPMEEFLSNVNEPIPMEIKEDSNQDAAVVSSVPVDIADMETQPMDLDVDVEPNGPPSEMVSSKSEEVPYYCEKCDQRPVDKEVPLNREDDKPEKRHFLTLVREDGFMLRVNDTVYVLRDPPTPKGQVVIDRPTYRTAGPLIPKDCDIFRIESLWKDAIGRRFAFGHHYVRPCETYHEHNRRFYRNEICRSPASEIISIDLIHGRCWVMDPATYCKGRPVGAEEEHVYICEFRVDKGNRSFSKAGKGAHSVCMKPFAFNYFETRIHITRNYHPHGVPSPDFKQKVGPIPTSASGGVQGDGKTKGKKGEEKARPGKTQSTLERLKISKRKGEQKERLKRILDKLQRNISVSPESAGKSERIDLSCMLGRQKQVKKLNLTR